MTCERVVPLDVATAIVAVGAIADLPDSLSVVAESVNIKPGELALIADQQVWAYQLPLAVEPHH